MPGIIGVLRAPSSELLPALRRLRKGRYEREEEEEVREQGETREKGKVAVATAQSPMWNEF